MITLEEATKKDIFRGREVPPTVLDVNHCTSSDHILRITDTLTLSGKRTGAFFWGKKSRICLPSLCPSLLFFSSSFCS